MYSNMDQQIATLCTSISNNLFWNLYKCCNCDVILLNYLRCYFKKIVKFYRNSYASYVKVLAAYKSNRLETFFIIIIKTLNYFKREIKKFEIFVLLRVLYFDHNESLNLKNHDRKKRVRKYNSS